jgi:hypothetical protein
LLRHLQGEFSAASLRRSGRSSFFLCFRPNSYSAIKTLSRLRFLSSISFFCLLAMFAGCSGQVTPPPPVPTTTALTLDEWKTLPLDVKYDGATFDRLRMTDQRLQDERAWMSFMATHIIPERKKDIPGVPGQPVVELPQ